MANMVYWAELQSELSDAGLNVVVDIPDSGSAWFGKIDGKTFVMTVSPKSDKDGLREFMIVSLYGQDEKKLIPLFSKFMGYEPFCKYLHKINSKASCTYEWDRKDSKNKLQEVKEDTDVYELQEFKEGFQTYATQDVSRFFQQFTSEIVNKWEEVVQKNQNAEWHCNRISHILPFIKKVNPRLGQKQSMFGLSIISLDFKSKNEREIVQYGLKPLLDAHILTEKEAEQIISWYLQTEPTWDSGGAGQFQKEFEIDKIKYRLITDSHRNYRDLNLQVIS